MYNLYHKLLLWIVWILSKTLVKNSLRFIFVNMKLNNVKCDNINPSRSGWARKKYLKLEMENFAESFSFLKQSGHFTLGARNKVCEELRRFERLRRERTMLSYSQSTCKLSLLRTISFVMSSNIIYIRITILFHYNHNLI